MQTRVHGSPLRPWLRRNPLDIWVCGAGPWTRFTFVRLCIATALDEEKGALGSVSFVPHIFFMQSTASVTNPTYSAGFP